MRVFITKYALTSGIQEREAEISTISERMIVFKGQDQYQQPVHKPFWHLTKEEAITHANQLRNQKLSSLQAQIKKLSIKEF